MSIDIYQDIATAYSAAATKAPGLKARFAAAGFDPAKVSSLADLSRLPVMKKRNFLNSKERDRHSAGFSPPT
ncbi:hypothetical protein [Neoaquamicrobium sediminum]|uniref:hypothetical protein n=1 Tax=Neoaquamicrobium sediminum TaxID=1849104 RepID=UPI0019D51FB1|nr:hypothetical protein [Mesorhizobium sediminum]